MPMRFRRYIFTCIVLIMAMMHAADAWAEKPDSAFGPEVWSREKISKLDILSRK